MTAPTPGTMKADLLALLARQWVSPQDALTVGCMSLAQRISNWRAAGYEFDQREERQGRARYAAYRLRRAPQGVAE